MFEPVKAKDVQVGDQMLMAESIGLATCETVKLTNQAGSTVRLIMRHGMVYVHDIDDQLIVWRPDAAMTERRTAMSGRG